MYAKKPCNTCNHTTTIGLHAYIMIVVFGNVRFSPHSVNFRIQIHSLGGIRNWGFTSKKLHYDFMHKNCYCATRLTTARYINFGKEKVKA